MPLREEQRLIEQIASEHPRSIEQAVLEILQKERARIAKIVKIGGGSPSDIEMILNDAVADLVHKIREGTFDRSRSGLSTYLYSIAKHKWLDELKQRHRYSNSDPFYLGEQSSGRADQSNIENKLFSKEEQEKIVRALQQLEPKCRELFDLKYLDGLTLRVIAERFQESEDAIKQRHKRCKEKLKKIFGKDPRID